MKKSIRALPDLARGSTLGLAILLAACGGGGGSDSSSSKQSLTGVFSDSPVAGLAYTTSSGLSGTTDDLGRYRYNSGDTVTFMVGDVVVGWPVPAQGLVTPQDLAAAAPAAQADALTNLLVFLQSLDSDGNPDNGIDISENVATAAASASLDFTQDPGTFAASGTLGTLIAAAGSNAGLVDSAAALEHFRKQFLANIQGSWDLIDTTSHTAMQLRLDNAGHYVFAAAKSTNAGIEYGTLDWDPETHALKVATDYDSNGSNGLSNPASASFLMKLDGNALVIEDPDNADPARATLTLTRAPDSFTGLVGTWIAPHVALPNHPDSVTFFADGTYLMADTDGDTSGSGCSGGPGVEYGRYSFSNGNFAVSAVPYVDTNNCAGFYDSDGPDTGGVAGTARVDKFLAYFDLGVDGTFPAFRTVQPDPTQLPAVTPADLPGAWYLVDASTPDAAPTTTSPFVVFQADGSYVFGATGADPNCSTDYSDNAQPGASYADGNNGSEYGSWSIDGSLGALVAGTPVMESNGSCGLYNAVLAKGDPETFHFMRKVDADTIEVTVYSLQDGGYNEANTGTLEEEHFFLKRFPSVAGTLTGAWIATAPDTSHDVWLFFADGSDFAIDTDEGGGVQTGTHTYSSGVLTFTTSSATPNCIDTIGSGSDCSLAPGDPNGAVALTVTADDGLTTLSFDEGTPFTFTKLK